MSVAVISNKNNEPNRGAWYVAALKLIAPHNNNQTVIINPDEQHEVPAGCAVVTADTPDKLPKK